MILNIESIRKRFGDSYAVNGVTFGVSKGSIYGLLGPNGAGKTTTIRMVLGILLPDEGRIDVFGGPLDLRARDRIGYLPEERGLYKKMKVRDLLLYFGRAHGMTKPLVLEKIDYWLQRLEFSHTRMKKTEELSKGMQQKIQFISTIIHSPELLILDEPFSGLDPINLQIMKDIVMEMSRQGTTIIFSTHNMEEAEKMCNAICLINKGKVVVEGDLQKVKSGFGKKSVIIEADGGFNLLKELDYIEKLDLYENYAELHLKPDTHPGRLLEAVAGRMDIRRFEVVAPTLRNIFIEQVKGDSNES